MFTVLFIITRPSGNFASYTFGAAVAILILGYLVYSLVKPEKF